MTYNELLADVYNRNVGFLEMTIADFSDADMIVRPVPSANHAAWQLGHLIASEVMMLQNSGVKLPELPAGFAERFTKETSKIDDPSKFATKAQLLDLLKKVRVASVAWVKTLTPADLGKPTPPDWQDWCPTIGHLAELLPTHVAMHMGQLQVIRRKLGKPVLF